MNIVSKLMALHMISRYDGYLELVKDIILDDKECHNRDSCLCSTCQHCESCIKFQNIELEGELDDAVKE